MATTLANLQILLSQCRAGTVPLASAAAAPARTIVASASPGRARFVDIGVNLLDTMFEGNYRGKQCHPPDLDAVLARAAECGVEHAIVTAGTLDESKRALELVRSQRAAGGPVRLHSTVGVHPTRCLEFLPATARAEVEAAMARVAAAGAADGGGADGGGADGGAERSALAALEEEVLSRPAVASSMAAHAEALGEVLRAGVAEGLVVAVGECGLDYDRLVFCPAGVQRAGFGCQLGMAAAAGLPLFLHNRNTGGDFGAVRAAHTDRDP